MQKMSKRNSSSSDDFVLIESELANVISDAAEECSTKKLNASSTEIVKISELENALALATKEISELRLENSKLHERLGRVTTDANQRIGVENVSYVLKILIQMLTFLGARKSISS